MLDSLNVLDELMLTRHDNQGRNKEKKVSLGVTAQNIGVTA
jgi:hypothetical protein